MIGASNRISAKEAAKLVDDYKEGLLEDIYKDIKEKARNGNRYLETSALTKFLKIHATAKLDDQPKFVQEIITFLTKDGYDVKLILENGRYENRLTIYW